MTRQAVCLGSLAAVALAAGWRADASGAPVLGVVFLVLGCGLIVACGLWWEES